MPKWKKITFVSILVVFVGLSVFFTFYSIARDTFEYHEKQNIDDIEGLNGWEFYGFSGNSATKEVHIDYVRDKKGNMPDEAKPVIAVGPFTVVSDEYVEFIYIGKDVKYISEQAFYYCKQLKAVFVDEENEWFCSVDGTLYNKDKTELLLHPICNGDWLVSEGKAETADTYDIPEGVERVGGYSFYKNWGLVHLTCPSTLKSIGDMAFFGCSGMWSVWLNEGLESIGNDAFSYCGSMSPIMYIPSSVKEIGHHAFFSCRSLTAFYMGADSESEITCGESWLPKSVKRAIVYVAPKPEYGKTLEAALSEKERLDGVTA